MIFLSYQLSLYIGLQENATAYDCHLTKININT